MHHDGRIDSSRRAFIKRAGITAAAAVWAVPTLQVVNMATASAGIKGRGPRHGQRHRHGRGLHHGPDPRHGPGYDRIETSVVERRDGDLDGVDVVELRW